MIRDEASQIQVDAADPNIHTWLTANAGSGKTRVLTDRVARLLLDGVDPQNILCLTYTKAAASEMQNRLFRRLGAWSMLPDVELERDLQNLGVDVQSNTIDLSLARQLFARAIETPGGLKIQTIHSFCANILRRFPLEAGISPLFKELDEVGSRQIREQVLDDLAEGEDSQILNEFLKHFSGSSLIDFTNSIVKDRALFEHPFDPKPVRSILKINEDVQPYTIFDTILTPGWRDLLKALSGAMAQGTVSDQKAAARLELLSKQEPSTDLLAQLEALFLFGEAASQPFAAKIDRFPTKAVREENPELVADLNDSMGRVETGREMRLGLLAFQRSEALHRFGNAYCGAYEQRKSELGVLDFDDLISKALALFQDPKVAQWVLFRIDGGIDHLLVDEAQDTSPAQWSVIRALTEEFTSGQSARESIRRTIFVVGDKKQSIYSFQGADPKELDRMRSHFDQSMKAANDHLTTPQLQHSFRSSPAILRFVDQVFSGPLGPAIGESALHLAFHDEMPGRVDLWPMFEPAEEEGNDGEWFEPVDQLQNTHHDIRLANEIADQIKHIISNEALPEKDKTTGKITPRKITEGDFLILVQRRSDLFNEIIRACKAKNLRVAGADRLELTAELAVKDIIAVLNFLSLPEDSLSLAAALKSPLFGWTEAELYALAYHREQDHLWPALRQSTDHPKTLEILNDLRSRSDFLRPFELIERLLTKHGGREELLSRLGSEAADGIDALLSQALKYESSGTPSLTGFLCWLEEEAAEIKRQMDTQTDQIRVMTVHGAKGLEAPIVILPDTAVRQNNVKNEILTVQDTAHLKPKADQAPKALRERIGTIKDLQEEERLRLFYVAMTRAENWLILCGAGKQGKNHESWYAIAEEAMSHSDVVDAKTGKLSIQRSQSEIWPELVEDLTDAQIENTLATPTYIVPNEPAQKDVLSPSDLGGAKGLPGETYIHERGKARGRVIHALLEQLPEINEEERLNAAKRIVANHPDGSEIEGDAVDRILGHLTDPQLAWVFSDEALAEVPIAANLSELRNTQIYGVIDRLIITREAVTAIDFKSNAEVPKAPEDTPDGLLRQMGAYAAALKQIYPDRVVNTALLWTETGEVMMLPNDLVSDALSRVNVS